MVKNRWDKLLFATSIFFTFIVISLYFLFLLDSVTYPTGDFIMLRMGGSILRSGQIKNLYSIPYQSDLFNNLATDTLGMRGLDLVLPFRYLPINTIIYLPFTFFEIFTAGYLLIAANLIIVAISSFVITRYLNRNNAFIISFGLSLFFPYTWLAFTKGHFLFMLLIFTMIFYFYAKNDYKKTGIISSLLFFKLSYLVFIPYLLLLIEDRKTFLKYFLLAITVFMGINILMYGPELFKDYLWFVRETEMDKFGSWPELMNTLNTVLYTYGIKNSSVSFPISVFFYLLSIFSIYFIKLRYKFNKLLLLGSTLFLTIFFSWHAYRHDMIILLIPALTALLSYKKSYMIAGFLIYLLVLIDFTTTPYQFGYRVALGLLFLGVYFIITSIGKKKVQPG